MNVNVYDPEPYSSEWASINNLRVRAEAASVILPPVPDGRTIPGPIDTERNDQFGVRNTCHTAYNHKISNLIYNRTKKRFQDIMDSAKILLARIK